MKTIAERIKADPAYVCVRVPTDGGDSVMVLGPDGLEVGFCRPGDAGLLISRLNEAFYRGVMHAEKKAAPSVPGPPNPPKKIHPR